MHITLIKGRSFFSHLLFCIFVKNTIYALRMEVVRPVLWQDSADFKTLEKPTLTISDHKVGSFPDMSMGYKIFYHGRICVLIADNK
jgi:hypothetical protein